MSLLIDPAQQLSDIKMLSEQQELQIQELNSSVPPALQQSLHEAFTEKALENPSAPAISSWEGNWTYAEVDLAATRLSKRLASLQTHEPTSRTALFCFDNSCTGIIALLAILKAGFTCLPIIASTEYVFTSSIEYLLVPLAHHCS